MMGKIGDVIAGIGILIGMYLVINNWSGSVAIVNAVAKNTTEGIKTLQGR